MRMSKSFFLFALFISLLPISQANSSSPQLTASWNGHIGYDENSRPSQPYYRGFAFNDATLNNCTLIHKTGALNNSEWRTLSVSSFIVGYNEQGKAIYVSPLHSLPSVYGNSIDIQGLSSRAESEFVDLIEKDLCKQIKRIEAFGDDNEDNSAYNLWISFQL